MFALRLDVMKGIVAGVATVSAAVVFYKIFTFYRENEDDEYFTKASFKKGSVEGVRNRRVLILGLDGAGKTRLIRSFRQGSCPGDVVPSPEPTIGFNVQSLVIDHVALDMWDVGGSIACRDYWGEFLLNIDVVLWVVDATNPLRFQESRQAFHNFLELPKTKGIPVIVVATKQDIRYAVSPLEVLEEMRVLRFESEHRFRCTGTQIPSKGFRQGIKRLFELITTV